MANYQQKKEDFIEDVQKIIEGLDINISVLDNLEADIKKHDIATWYYEKKALHEIKRILHKINKYDQYDEKEIEITEIMFEKKFKQWDE